MEELALAVLRKYEIRHDGVERLLESAQHISYLVKGTDYLLRLSKDVDDAVEMQNGLTVAVALARTGCRFVSPAFPLVLESNTKEEPVIRATLWYYEARSTTQIDYKALGSSIKSLQTEGSATIKALGLPLPNALSLGDIDVFLGADDNPLTDSERGLVAGWTSKLDKFFSRYENALLVLSHNNLTPSNVLMTTHGLLLCDPDTFSWSLPENDLAFLTRARDEGKLKRDQIIQFEQGYGGKLPNNTLTSQLSLLHDLRRACELSEFRDVPSAAQEMERIFTHLKRKSGFSSRGK